MSKTQFKDVDSKVDFIKIEHEILDFWKDEDVFNHCLRQSSDLS